MKELFEKNKGKLVIGAIIILVGAAGTYGGVEITSKPDGGVCIGISTGEVE